MNKDMVAYCGMNCSLCVSYQAGLYDINSQGFNRWYCLGCIPIGKHCTFLKNHCVHITKGEYRFCFECVDFPCKRLIDLDKRYRLRYHMSMIDNLQFIKEKGIELFIEDQIKQWSCDKCGELICCHINTCISCELKLSRNNQKKGKDK